MSLSSIIVLVLALLFFGGIAVLARTSKQQSAQADAHAESDSSTAGRPVSAMRGPATINPAVPHHGQNKADDHRKRRTA